MKRRLEGPIMPLRDNETSVSKPHYSTCRCWLCKILIAAGKKTGGKHERVTGSAG